MQLNERHPAPVLSSDSSSRGWVIHAGSGVPYHAHKHAIQRAEMPLQCLRFIPENGVIHAVTMLDPLNVIPEVPSANDLTYKLKSPL